MIKIFAAVIIVGLSAGIIIIILNPQIPFPLKSSGSKAPTLEELRYYTLSEINEERSKHGLKNVTLSDVDCAQPHAENMLAYGYISHWDTNGTKPYMRYTEAGGRGAVSENVAWMYSSGGIDLYRSIHDLGWDMVYNDSASNWGHRDNILNPLHNRVSIGVAWDRNNVYLVQDFEDDYFITAEVQQSGDLITLTYQSSQRNWTPTQIAIFYDPLPKELDPKQLSVPPFNDGYDAGTHVGSVLPKGYFTQQGITITASSWQTGSSTLQASFTMRKAFQTKGYGVYTLYVSASNKYWTTLSIWYEG